ncbi:MAG: SDR family NAD(P)-dependent oxidoreductase [Promethearchaeota archaeon]
MVSYKILITGGAGFIGSHLCDRLIKAGHEVTIYDNLDPQVHKYSEPPKIPPYLNKKASFIHADIRDEQKLKEAIEGHEIIFHLAASVGVRQSFDLIKKYTDTNMGGTANLLNILVNNILKNKNSVKKLIVASSNTIYGEGSYLCENCGEFYPPLRKKGQLDSKDWEIKCPKCGRTAKPIPTSEDHPEQSSSPYALSKYVEEKEALMIGKTYGLDTTILRFFLVYGSRQSLSNPYTGVCSIFASRLLNGEAPLIFEDGLQTRDFVHVNDVCQALELAMNTPKSKYEVFNVGSGKKISIKEVADIIASIINPKIRPIITQEYREGDIRHCFADISKIKKALNYNPIYDFKTGIKEFIDWVKKEAQNRK